jgi:hypothetical protein
MSNNNVRDSVIVLTFLAVLGNIYLQFKFYELHEMQYKILLYRCSTSIGKQ